MPRDPRPYVTYPINYTGHPRVALLSDAAFRAFHEMQDHSRVYGLDGLIPAALARMKWSQKTLDELVNGVDDRPLVVLTEKGYLSRSYDEHQLTTSDVEALRKKRADAGSMGGKAKAAASKTGSAALASATENGWQNVAESKSKSKSNPDTQLLTPESLEVDADDFTTDEIQGFRSSLTNFGAAGFDDLSLVTLVQLLLEASPRPVMNNVGYIVRCTQRSPEKVRGLAVEAERQAGRVRSVLGGVE
jgi:hypothetical protein